MAIDPLQSCRQNHLIAVRNLLAEELERRSNLLHTHYHHRCTHSYTRRKHTKYYKELAWEKERGMEQVGVAAYSTHLDNHRSHRYTHWDMLHCCMNSSPHPYCNLLLDNSAEVVEYCHRNHQGMKLMSHHYCKVCRRNSQKVELMSYTHWDNLNHYRCTHWDMWCNYMSNFLDLDCSLLLDK